MKKGMVFLMVFLVFASPSLAVKSWSFVFSPGCELCVEGMGINSSLVIENQGDEALEISKLTLVDSDNVAFFSSLMQGTVGVGKSLTINFILLLPPATRGSTLFYKPCIEIRGKEMCADSFTTMFIEPLNRIECTKDSACQYNEVCENYRCREFSCGGIAKDHKCQAITFERAAGLIAVALLGIVLFLLLSKKRYL